MSRLMFTAVIIVCTLGFVVGNPFFNDHPLDSCVCKTYSCECCFTTCVPQIRLNDTVCVSFAYLPDSYGISFIISLDDKALINETISARNPPPICFPVPYLEDFVDGCVHFTDLSIKNDDFHGCVALELRMWWVYVVAEYDLGCFDTNKSRKKFKQLIKEVKVMKVPAFNGSSNNFPNATASVMYKYIGNITASGIYKNIRYAADNDRYNFVGNVTVASDEDGKIHIVTHPPNSHVHTDEMENQVVFRYSSKVNQTTISAGTALCSSGSNKIVIPLFSLVIGLMTIITANSCISSMYIKY